jgi:hypothetical protein
MELIYLDCDKSNTNLVLFCPTKGWSDSLKGAVAESSIAPTVAAKM